MIKRVDNARRPPRKSGAVQVTIPGALVLMARVFGVGATIGAVVFVGVRQVQIERHAPAGVYFCELELVTPQLFDVIAVDLENYTKVTQAQERMCPGREPIRIHTMDDAFMVRYTSEQLYPQRYAEAEPGVRHGEAAP